MGINDTFFNEFEVVYSLKNDYTEIDTMREFCEKWEISADVEYIPYMMKLFSDKADSAQNEFVILALDKISKKNYKEAYTIIINNLLILEDEKAINCLLYISAYLIRWNINIESFAKTLAHGNDKCRDLLINYIIENDLKKLEIKRSNNSRTQEAYEKYIEFIDIYERELKSIKSIY